MVRARARRIRHAPGKMNKTETKFLTELRAREARGELCDIHFESVTLVLANNTRYTPDFMATCLEDGSLILYDVKAAWKTTSGYKAHWEDDAKVKVKVAATTFPQFRFVGAALLPQKAGGGWIEEEFPPR